MPELVRLIIGHTNDRDFWSARQSHRMFRLRHTAAELERRVAYRWTRVSPEHACRCKRADVLSFLYRRRRVPRTFAPWPIVAETGDDATLAVIVRHGPRILAGDGGSIIAMAIDHGHLNVVLSACTLFNKMGDHAMHYALRRKRPDIALAVYKALDAVPHDLARAGARADCVETVEAVIRDHPSVSLTDIAETAADNGSLSVICHIMATRHASPSWHGPFLSAIKHGYLRVVRAIVCSEALVGPLDLKLAIGEAAARGHTAIVDFLLDTVDWSRLNCKAAVDAAMRAASGFESLYTMYDRGVPVDLQRAFDRYAARGCALAVAYMCTKSPWLDRQKAVETTMHARVVRAIVEAGRDGIDLDAAIAAQESLTRSSKSMHGIIRAYLIRERACLPTAAPPSRPLPYVASEPQR